jgi:hypothetical protein
VTTATATLPEMVPTTPEELVACLASWEWRIFSGQIYKIIVKDDDDPDDPGVVKAFIPNAMQRDLLMKLHHRNVVLKARQLGCTTLVAILWLDHALFNANQRCGIIAQTLPLASAILRDKVKFAYDHLPEGLRARMPTIPPTNEEEITFGHNGSSIAVGTSFRSGTFHRLHVSEMGKIAATSPAKAREVVAGSIPTVPSSGIAIVESTAEGQSGEFYTMASRAEALAQRGLPLAAAEYAFHFYAWWFSDEYEADPEGVEISPADHAYFADVESKIGRPLSPRKRAWYILQREQTFGGDAEKMWTEYPSTSAECWQRSTEGAFLAPQLARARVEGRIGRVPHLPGVPVNTFWDIGASDGTGIWLHQHVAAENRFLRYIEGWDSGYDEYVSVLNATGYVWGTHFMPHDVIHERQGVNGTASPLSMLRTLAPSWNFYVVPRVQTFEAGMTMLRQTFPTYLFDAEGCKEGLIHLAEYRKAWNSQLGVWKDTPPPDSPHREAADSLRQHAQGFRPELVGRTAATARRSRRALGGMVV